ncbi:MAG: AMIN domain-containing protein [Pseudomonadota bacterium]
MPSKISLFLFAGFLGIYSFPAAALETKEKTLTNAVKKASELINFQIEEEPNILRLVILGNGRIEAYRSHILNQPLRFIVDIPNVTLRDRKEFIPIIHPAVEVIRLGLHPDKVRIVFDFKGVVIPRYRIFQRDHSLIISIET